MPDAEIERSSLPIRRPQDNLPEETFARQKQLGVVPADAELPPRNDAFPTWDSLDETHKRLYARQMSLVRCGSGNGSSARNEVLSP